MNRRLANWIRRHRASWLERKATEMEAEFAGTPFADVIAAEAQRMRALAKSLRA